MPFDPPPIVTDPDTIADDLLDRLADALPGWSPVEGSVETALAEEFAVESAVVAQAAVDSIETALAGIGETVFSIPSYSGAAATLPVQITVTTTGDVIPSGFTAIGTNPAGTEVAFTLPGEIVTDATTATAALTCTTDGLEGNGIPAGPLVVATSTATVISAAALGASSGGLDGESVTAYLSRLVDQLSVLRFGGVRAEDMAILARSVPGVDRALGVDLYDPANPGVDSERTVTVFPIDADDQPVSSEVADAVQAKLEAAREVNFIVHVGTPTYTAVDVTYAAVAEVGADPVQVKANIDAALTTYLTDWGITEADPHAWTGAAGVRFLDVARIAGSAVGVGYLSSLTVNGGTVDVTLDGVAALVAPLAGVDVPSSITGTVIS